MSEYCRLTWTLRTSNGCSFDDTESVPGITGGLAQAHGDWSGSGDLGESCDQEEYGDK